MHTATQRTPTKSHERPRKHLWLGRQGLHRILNISPGRLNACQQRHQSFILDCKTIALEVSKLSGTTMVSPENRAREMRSMVIDFDTRVLDAFYQFQSNVGCNHERHAFCAVRSTFKHCGQVSIRSRVGPTCLLDLVVIRSMVYTPSGKSLLLLIEGSYEFIIVRGQRHSHLRQKHESAASSAYLQAFLVHVKIASAITECRAHLNRTAEAPISMFNRSTTKGMPPSKDLAKFPIPDLHSTRATPLDYAYRRRLEQSHELPNPHCFAPLVGYHSRIHELFWPCYSYSFLMEVSMWFEFNWKSWLAGVWSVGWKLGVAPGLGSF